MVTLLCFPIYKHYKNVFTSCKNKLLEHREKYLSILIYCVIPSHLNVLRHSAENVRMIRLKDFDFYNYDFYLFKHWTEL